MTGTPASARRFVAFAPRASPRAGHAGDVFWRVTGTGVLAGRVLGGHIDSCAGVPVTSGRQNGNLALVTSGGNRVDDQGFSA